MVTQPLRFILPATHSKLSLPLVMTLSERLIYWIRKYYRRRLMRALSGSFSAPIFFPSGIARALTRYLKDGRSMLVLTAQEGKGVAFINAKSIDFWETDFGDGQNESERRAVDGVWRGTGIGQTATDDEKREVLLAFIRHYESRRLTVRIFDPQPWQDPLETTRHD
jgi:hypothetical protein